MSNPLLARRVSNLIRRASKEINAYLHIEHLNIFRSIIVDFPPNNAPENLFVKCWGKYYEEIVNIMPSANMLQNSDFN
jgi:hypothetical protein